MGGVGYYANLGKGYYTPYRYREYVRPALDTERSGVFHFPRGDK